MIETAKFDTKHRILDAAERLFSEHGVAPTSLRSIIAAAHVNLAAIHYHYRSKDALLEAVLVRRIAGVNAERLALLDAAEREAAPGPPPVERIVEAFVLPTLRVAYDASRGGSVFARLIGRVLSEAGEVIPRLMMTHFGDGVARFHKALARALPQLPPEDLIWRIFFSVGVMAHTLRNTQDLARLTGGRCDPNDIEAINRRLVAFATAGLTAPLAASASQEAA